MRAVVGVGDGGEAAPAGLSKEIQRYLSQLAPPYAHLQGNQLPQLGEFRQHRRLCGLGAAAARGVGVGVIGVIGGGRGRHRPTVRKRRPHPHRPARREAAGGALALRLGAGRSGSSAGSGGIGAGSHTCGAEAARRRRASPGRRAERCAVRLRALLTAWSRARAPCTSRASRSSGERDRRAPSPATRPPGGCLSRMPPLAAEA